MSPNQMCQIYNANDELVQLRVLTLSTWVNAIKLEMKTGMTHSSGSIYSLACEFLSASENEFSIQELYNYLALALKNIKIALGLIDEAELTDHEHFINAISEFTEA